MSIIASILEPRTKFIGPLHPRDPVLAEIFGVGADTLAGVTVNERTAMALSAVYACIRVISEDVAKLPLILYRRRSDRGKDRMVGHPLFNLLHDSPNEEMGSFGWRETQTGWALSWGNGYAEIERDGAGRPVALHPLGDALGELVPARPGDFDHPAQPALGHQLTHQPEPQTSAGAQDAT